MRRSLSDNANARSIDDLAARCTEREQELSEARKHVSELERRLEEQDQRHAQLERASSELAAAQSTAANVAMQLASAQKDVETKTDVIVELKKSKSALEAKYASCS